MNGANHWYIPKIVSYEPKENSKFEYNISKNIYGKSIHGRPERVIAQLIQLYIFHKAKNKEIAFNLKWFEVIDVLNKIKSHLYKWKIKGYETIVGKI